MYSVLTSLPFFTQGEMFAYLRKEHALSAAQLLSGERAQQQHRAASRVQALARGRRARVYVAGIYCASKYALQCCCGIF